MCRSTAPGDADELRQQLLDECAIRTRVRSGDLHIERRGQAEVQDLADDVGRQKLELRGGVGGRELLAQVALIVIQGGVLLREVDEDIRIARTDRRRGAVGEIDAAVRQSQIVDDGGDLARLDGIAQRLLHLIAENGGLLDARAGGCPQMQLQLSGIDVREEILSQARQRADRKCQQCRRGDREQENPGEGRPPSIASVEQLPVAAAHALEARARTAPESAPSADLRRPGPRLSSSARIWPASGSRFATGCKRRAWRTPRPRRAE